LIVLIVRFIIVGELGVDCYDIASIREIRPASDNGWRPNQVVFLKDFHFDVRHAQRRADRNKMID
jgi:hypothetical protein